VCGDVQCARQRSSWDVGAAGLTALPLLTANEILLYDDPFANADPDY
jgi:hypothetical protein